MQMIWALDVASNTGVAEGVIGQTPKLYSVRFAKKDQTHDDSFGKAIKWIANRLQVERPDLVFIEAPIPASQMRGKTNADTTALLFGLVACIGGVLRAKNIPVRRCNIGAVRKHFIGHGNLKGEIAKPRTFRLCEVLGWEPPDMDASDAGAVWHYGCSQINADFTQRIDPLLIGQATGAAA